MILIQALVVRSARKPNWLERALGHTRPKEWGRTAGAVAVTHGGPAGDRWWPLHEWAEQLSPRRGRSVSARQLETWVNRLFLAALAAFAAALAYYWM